MYTENVIVELQGKFKKKWKMENGEWEMWAMKEE